MSYIYKIFLQNVYGSYETDIIKFYIHHLSVFVHLQYLNPVGMIDQKLQTLEPRMQSNEAFFGTQSKIQLYNSHSKDQNIVQLSKPHHPLQYEKEINSLRSQINHLKKEALNASYQKRGLQDKLDESEKQYLDLSKKYETLSTENGDMKSIVEGLAASNFQDVKGLKGIIEVLNQPRLSSMASIKLQKIKRTVSQDWQQRQRKKHGYMKIVRQGAIKVTGLRRQVSNQRQKELEARIDELKHSIQYWQKQTRQLREQIDQTDLLFKDKLDQNSQLKKDIQKKEAKIAFLQQTIVVMKGRMQNLEQERKAVVQLNRSLKYQNQVLTLQQSLQQADRSEQNPAAGKFSVDFK